MIVSADSLRNSQELISVNPYTHEEVWRGPVSRMSDVDDAMLAAERAWQEWRLRSSRSRLALLKKVENELRRRHDQLARLIVAEVGKPLWEAQVEAHAVINKFAVVRKSYQKRLRPQRLLDGQAQWISASLGVIAVLGPFNLPAHLPNGQIVPALIAGNVVVFKPSELTPAVGQFLVDIYNKFLPPGVLTVLHGDAAIGTKVVEHDALAGIFFTGSRKAGVAIHAAQAGRPERLLALEMGGNNPIVVWDADPKAAARLIVDSAFVTTGQRCVCARRLYIRDDPVGDQVILEVQRRLLAMRVGDPLDPEPVFMGTLISQASADQAINRVQQWLDAGAQSLFSCKRLSGHQPLITAGLYDCTDVHLHADEEWFAPLLQVYRCSSFDDALQQVNTTRYGLSAGFIGRDSDRWQQFASVMRAGVLYWNRHITGASGQLPFGGWGWSGNHRPAGFTMIDHCAQAQAQQWRSEPADTGAFPGIAKE